MIIKEGINKKNRLFANIGKLITSSLESDVILDRIMHEVQLYFSPQHWSLLRYDITSEQLYFAIVEGSDFELLKDIKLKKGEGIAGEVVSTGQSIFVPDTSKDNRFSNKVDNQIGFKTESIIAVPIKIQETVYGVIEIINLENHHFFNEEDHLILKTIADFSAIAFYNSSIYEKAIIKSELDGLTGLYNKTKLKKVIKDYSAKEKLGRRESDNNIGLIVVYMDLNRFKDINDNYGHREGDKVLKNVAMRLNSIFRSDDLTFRTGGDEFVTIMFIQERNHSDEIIKRIERTLKTETITSLELNYQVTLSYGVEKGSIAQIEDLIDRADKAMYYNKKNRR